MSQYWFDWSNDIIGQAPSGITNRFTANHTLEVVANADSPSGKALRWTLNSTARRAITFDAISGDTGCGAVTVKMLARRVSASTANSQIGAAVRVAGGIATENMAVSRFYQGTSLRMSRYFGSGTFEDLTNISGAYAANDTGLRYILYNYDSVSVPTVNRSKGWDYGSTEPETWTAANNPNLTVTDGIGIFANDSGSAYEILYVAVGTNGDEPPTGPLEPPPEDEQEPVLTSATGLATGDKTATGAVTTDEGNGTLYAVVTESATSPSAAQVQGGKDHTGADAAWSGSQSVSSPGSKSFYATALSAETTYYFHFQHTDAANNASSVVSTASFTTDEESGLPDEPTITEPLDTGNVDLSAVAYTWDGTNSRWLIDFEPRKQSPGGRTGWQYWYFKITNPGANAPVFRTVGADMWTGSLATQTAGSWVPVWTQTPEDLESWSNFDNVSRVDPITSFWHDTPFPVGDIYVAYKEVWTTQMTENWVSDLHADGKISRTDSDIAETGTPSYRLEDHPASQNELAKTIPALPMWAFRFGTGSRKIAVIGGQHSGEHQGNINLYYFVEWLLSAAEDAVYLRSLFTFNVYPVVNPTGRYGGHYRTAYDPVSGQINPNERWWDDLTQSTIHCVRIVRDAILMDCGYPGVDSDFVSFMDFHGFVDGRGIYFKDDTIGHAFCDAAAARFAPLTFTKLNGGTALKTDATIGTARRAFFDCQLSMTVEIGTKVTSVPAVAATYGPSVAGAYYDIASTYWVADVTETLDTLIASASSVTDRQAYRDTCDVLIQSGVSVAAVQQMVESLITLGQTVSSVTDTTGTPPISESLLTTAVSAASVSAAQAYVETVTTLAHSGSSLAEVLGLIEQLGTVAESVSSAQDRQLYYANVAIVALSSSSLAEVGAYIEQVSAAAVSVSGVADVLVGSFVGRYVFVDYCRSRTFDDLAQPRAFVDYCRPRGRVLQ